MVLLLKFHFFIVSILSFAMESGFLSRKDPDDDRQYFLPNSEKGLDFIPSGPFICMLPPNPGFPEST